jgi:hypothetical protein
MIDYYKISILIILPEIQYTNGKNKDKGKFINKKLPLLCRNSYPSKISERLFL